MSTLRRYLAHALHDAGRVELRQIEAGHTRSGIYDNIVALEDAVVAIADVSTVYTTLNAPKLRQAENAMTGKALTDAEIGHVVRLPFDFDTVRPAGVNANAAEIDAAEARRDRFVATMRTEGFPMPLLGMSGNGAHAVYRCRLPASDMLRDLLATMYTTLKSDYSDERVLFDTTVRNFSRIWRIYGTENRKYPATSERPHRVAQCVIPGHWECVSPQALVRFANLCAKRNERAERPAPVPRDNVNLGAGDYATLDAVRWFAAHGHYKRPMPGGKHAVFCPWADEHTTDSGPMGSDTVIFDPEHAEQWPAFHCSHAHCDGRGITAVMALWRDADEYCAREFQRRAQ